MSDSVIQEFAGERDDVLDVERLIEAVRGSRAAQIQFELRPWLLRSGDPTVDEAASSFTAPPSDEFTRPNVIQP